MEAVFLRLLNMSITASYVIAAVLLIRLLLRKAPKKYSYWLWSVVGFRLCCPVSFESVLSIFSFKPFDMSAAQSAGGAALQYVPYDIGFMAQPAVTVGIPAANNFISSSLPAATPAASINPVQIWTGIAAAVWCLGVAALLIYSVVTYVRLNKQMSSAILLEGNVWQSDTLRSPFVLGFFRPRIYLPFGLDADTQRYVLTHERYHINRFDHIVKPFAFLLLTLHWFNPLCWLAFVLMGRDMEMSCDEKVLSSEEHSAKAYSTSLLSFAANRRFPAPTPLAFGETGARSRIKNALKWRRPTRLITVLAVVLCITVVAACAANPPTSEPDANPLNVESLVSLAAQQPDDALKATYTVLNVNEVQVSASAVAGYLSSVPWQEHTSGGPYERVADLVFIWADETQLLFFEDAPNLALVISGDKWRYYDIADGDYEAAVALLNTRPSIRPSGTYVFSDVIYSNPISSYLPIGGTGYKYVFNGETFSVVDEETGESVKYFEGIGWNWGLITDEAWKSLFEVEEFAPDISSYSKPLMLTLSESDFLFNMDGALWLAEYRPNGPPMANGMWSIYALVPENSSAPTVGGEDSPTDNLEARVSAAILEQNKGTNGETAFSCESHVTLATGAGSIAGTNITDTVTVYAMVLYQEFAFPDGAVSLVSGSHIPTALTFSVSKDGEYELTEYWIPRDGNYYAEDIKAKFPEGAWADALDTQKFILAQMQACYAQAVKYGNVDTPAVIESLFEAIMSSPATSSNAGDYVGAHPIECRELSYYGDYTLHYIFTEFLKGDQTGLKGHIMRIVMDDLSGEALKLQTDTGQEYFDAWLKAAQDTLAEHGKEHMIENIPKSYMLLQMIADA